MEYEINKQYPFSELENISKWWQNNKQYDVNAIKETRVYTTKLIKDIHPKTGEEIVVGEEDVVEEREYNDYVEIVKRSDEQIIEDLRRQREYECFPYINRGSLWYNTLTESQKSEFQEWYASWLNVTNTFIAPKKPEWLN